MDIIISNQSGKPIYDQISDQLRAQILSGALQEGQALPSLRLLAKELHVSVITTRRAYDELEQAGLVVQVAGKGCFVAATDTDLVLEARRCDIERLLSQAVELARQNGIATTELVDMLEILSEQ